jgi:hypothetical protein
MTRKHIQELGKLIEIGITQELADTGDPGIVFRRLFGIGFGIDAHGPKFQTGERATQETYASLNKENGTAGIQFDQHIKDGEQPAKNEHQHKYGNRYVEDPFSKKVLVATSDIGA